MHYRNGREAKNGDKCIMLDEKGHIVSFGVLYDAQPGNDYCNGYIAKIEQQTYACIIDGLHIDDVAKILTEHGLEKRPLKSI